MAYYGLLAKNFNRRRMETSNKNCNCAGNYYATFIMTWLLLAPQPLHIEARQDSQSTNAMCCFSPSSKSPEITFHDLSCFLLFYLFILNDHLHKILQTTLLTKSLYQLHYL